MRMIMVYATGMALLLMIAASIGLAGVGLVRKGMRDETGLGARTGEILAAIKQKDVTRMTQAEYLVYVQYYDLF